MPCVSSSSVTRSWYRPGASGATVPSAGRATVPSASGTTCDGTSGFGAISATSFSTSRLLRCRALASSSPWFSTVRCGASRFTAVRWMSPRAIISSTSGNRRAVRAAQIRLPAALSDMCSRSTQNANNDEHASRRCNPRSSTSARYASSSAVVWFARLTSTCTRSSTRSSDISSKQTLSMFSP